MAARINILIVDRFGLYPFFIWTNKNEHICKWKWAEPCPYEIRGASAHGLFARFSWRKSFTFSTSASFFPQKQSFCGRHTKPLWIHVSKFAALGRGFFHSVHSHIGSRLSLAGDHAGSPLRIPVSKCDFPGLPQNVNAVRFAGKRRRRRLRRWFFAGKPSKCAEHRRCHASGRPHNVRTRPLSHKSKAFAGTLRSPQRECEQKG